MGLANGIEIVADPTTRQPDARRATAVKEGMRHAGVLIGTTGPQSNVLKVRPPLAFTEAHVPAFVGALEETLQTLGA
jgi:4-aminobutyrate aminotransferase-like enzyme